MTKPPRWALLSTSNKEGLRPLAEGLLAWGFRLVASSGTARHLREAGVKVEDVGTLTGTGDMLGGRVKTLHPLVMAGILARRDSPEDLEELEKAGGVPLDVIVVNLYPFEDVVKEEGSMEEIVENIDIGGVTLIRAAAKNWAHVSVLTDPGQYPSFLKELEASEGSASEEKRLRWAQEAFAVTSRYETAIYNGLARDRGIFPPEFRLAYREAGKLRYGENPYQAAAFYRDPSYVGASVAGAEDIFQRGLSFNNILDLDSGLELVMKFDRPTAAIIKHTNASGVASAGRLSEAYLLARQTDPKSAYGCVVGFNRSVDLDAAEAMRKHFVEAVIAPDFEPGALEVLRKKKKLRALRTGPLDWTPAIHVMGIRGGLLAQTKERVRLGSEDLRCVTKRGPTGAQIEAMAFAYRVLGHVKSNAIVLAKGERTVGIGSGQMSRVDSVIVAAMKAGEESRGSVLASDAFFPFRDGVDEAARAGVEAIIQPGGSIRDQEVIQAADEHGLTMVFTGVRVFRH